MPFEKMTKPIYPKRLWALVGYAGGGKSTFSTQMRAPLLPIDADHRYDEVINLVEGDVYQLSSDPTDSMNPEAIYRLLGENMPGSGTQTIVVDSLTAIITPKVTTAVLESDARRERNRQKKAEGRRDLENLTSPFKDKALTMRLLQDAVTQWGTDVLWIYHLQDSRDENAKEVTKPILSPTERARLYRSINMELHIVESADGKRRGVKVVWARRGRSGMTIWDDSGKWVGMPEKIEAAVYDGLSQAEQDKIEQAAPGIFPTAEAAIEYGLTRGAFKAFQHSKNAYDKFQREHSKENPEQLGLLWAEEVERRAAANGNGNGGKEAEVQPDEVARRGQASLAPPAETPANLPTNLKDLFEVVNQRVQVPFDTMYDLQQAIGGKLPRPNDKEGWQRVYEAAIAQANTKTQTPQQVKEIDF